tara:strand:- start:3346 stop:4062 length:717 start_codon:yes stop_codon:yes gene_type:complete
MPFQSEAQRRYLWANEPEIARDWTETYGSRIEKNTGGIMRVPFRFGGGYQGSKASPVERPSQREERMVSIPSSYTPAQAGTLSDSREKQDSFEQSWSGQPGILGLSGGYRNLRTPSDTSGGYRRNPLGILSALGGMFMGLPGVGLGINALRNFPKYNTLADWWSNRADWRDQTPNYDDMSRFNKLGLYGINRQPWDMRYYTEDEDVEKFRDVERFGSVAPRDTGLYTAADKWYPPTEA